ncbi:hypothetical protein C7M84_001730 [Penaeus vannamei]|uniref:Uncharacterized protein n=1 Tax=Penaeus vannamei TaxID=6689 RepID=A0A423TSU4_PENVA|nr:hypothetical protein C7M84_001730 [Penaeus vannamei]
MARTVLMLAALVAVTEPFVQHSRPALIAPVPSNPRKTIYLSSISNQLSETRREAPRRVLRVASSAGPPKARGSLPARRSWVSEAAGVLEHNISWYKTMTISSLLLSKVPSVMMLAGQYRAALVVMTIDWHHVGRYPLLLVPVRMMWHSTTARRRSFLIPNHPPKAYLSNILQAHLTILHSNSLRAQTEIAPSRRPAFACRETAP